MNVQPCEVLHTSILALPADVVGFLGDLNNWKAWAPWVRSVSRESPRDWTLDTDVGRMHMHFVEPNALGVLDHRVTLPSGVTMLNSMRVIPNDSGSELVMVLVRHPTTSADEFARDIEAVRADLGRIKAAVERVRAA
jgi:hypothetical protein